MSAPTPADEISAAATLIRAHADKATPGPWTASPVWSPRAQNTSAVYSAALPPGSEVIGSTRSNAVVGPTRKFGGCWRPQDAEYIALMHPVVATAVADLLDGYVADYATSTDRPECPSCDTGYCGPHPEVTYHEQCDNPVTDCPCIRPYLDLARAINGGAR